MGQKYTNEYVRQIAYDRFPSGYDFSNVIVTSAKSKVLVICDKHGKVELLVSNLTKGKHACPKCAQDFRVSNYSPTKVKNAANRFPINGAQVHSGKYNYAKVEYSANDIPVVITCPVHGDFKQRPSDHLSGNGCKQCASDNIKHSLLKTNEEFISTSERKHSFKYSYDNCSYSGMQRSVLVTCKTHGDFEVLATNHVHNLTGCPKCVHQISTHETLLLNKLSNIATISTSDRTVIPPLELDLYLPEHNLAIEVDGRYWHSERNGKDKDYHINKTRLCATAGVRLLHFWDDEIDNKLEIIYSMVSSRLGKSSKVYARKCKIIELSPEECSTFLQANHLQGVAQASVRLGLMLDGELIQVMTLSASRFTNDAEWEIVRLASKLGVSVVGGASKLFNRFVIQYSPKSVVSYADLRYATGAVYKTLGFTYSHDSKPNYFYVKDGKNISRYASQKHKLESLLGAKFNKDLSEHANMIAAGYERVYDCGNSIFLRRF